MSNLEVPNTSRHIFDLPPEIMLTIFGHLTFHERLAISVTCKSWHALAYSPLQCKKLFLYLRSADDLVKKPYAKEMLSRCRNIVITCNLIEDDHLELLKEFMEGISLDLLKISTTEFTAKRIMESVLQKIATLKTLWLDLEVRSDFYLGKCIRVSHPTLKCAILSEQWHHANECENLTILESRLVDEAGVRGLSALQKQLKRLTLSGPYQQIYTYLSDSEYISQWDHLQELYLNFPPYGDTLASMLDRMPCLAKLCINNDEYDEDFTGNELGTAKCLSELTLKKCSVDVRLLNQYLLRSTLQSLTLLGCELVNGTLEALKSTTIKRITYERLSSLYLLPLLPNLEELNLQCSEAHYTNTVNKICEYYPKLERLSIGVGRGQFEEFESTTGQTIDTNPFLRLNTLVKLKVLQINRINLRRFDWTPCKGSRVELIRLEGCSISGTAAEQLLQSFQHLRAFHLDHCYLQLPQASLFDIKESCVNGLRSRFPNARISYYECHTQVLYLLDAI